MKARVKATGEIKEVTRGIYSPYQYVDKAGLRSIPIDPTQFPEVTFENSPMEVELVIKK